jgi:hypothetical protein
MRSFICSEIRLSSSSCARAARSPFDLGYLVEWFPLGTGFNMEFIKLAWSVTIFGLELLPILETQPLFG